MSLLGNYEPNCLECIDSYLDDGHLTDFILNFLCGDCRTVVLRVTRCELNLLSEV